MAGQNIKTNYKSPHPDATDVSSAEERHADRRQLNRELREQQKPKKPSMRESTSNLFSGKNIVETGRSALRSGSAGIQNVGSRVASIGRSSPHVSFAGGGLVPAWTVGAKIPKEFMSMPMVRTEVRAAKPKKRKRRKEQAPVSTRPEWIRF
jgi:hypothetical protein